MTRFSNRQHLAERNIAQWMLLPFTRIIDYRGRSRRREYWWFTLLFAMAMVAAIALEIMLGTVQVDENRRGLIFLGCSLLFAIAGLPLQIRRFHDQNWSGWWVLMGMIPYIGVGFLLVFMLTEGTVGANRFGPDTKDPQRNKVFLD